MVKIRFLFLALSGCILPSMSTAQEILVDHTSLALFDQIPEQYLQQARSLRILFMDRSVGVNTHDSLDCFTASSYGRSRPGCRRDYQYIGGSWQLTLRDDSDVVGGQVHPYILFSPNAALYDRSNWDFYYFAETWDRMASDFINGLNSGAIPANVWLTPPAVGERILLDPMDFDVLSFQFSYLNVDEGSTIVNFFSDLPGEFNDVHDLEREVGENLTNANPRRYFVYWTSSLARGIGTDEATEFNDLMRQWCSQNNLILFDFADIQSHDMSSNACYDNRDGVPYTTPQGNASENHPDDGRNIPAICQEKTQETDGGHLGTAQGYISVAKGFWILAARLAGWDPGSTQTPPAAPTNLRVVPD